MSVIQIPSVFKQVIFSGFLANFWRLLAIYASTFSDRRVPMAHHQEGSRARPDERSHPG